MIIKDEQRLYKALYREDFKSFARKAFMINRSANEYKDNFHIDIIVDHLERVKSGKIKRLIVNLLPRSLKSHLISHAFPAFMLGHNPNMRFICVSYNQNLANSDGLDCKKIIEHEFYKYIFPNTKILSDADSKSDFKTTAGGERFATGVGGTLTGKGGDFIIIDDPLKPEDAGGISLDKLNQWYSSTLYSRLDDRQKGVIIIVMQRLHINDLCGFLLEKDDSWVHLNFAAIAEEDEEWEYKNKIYRRKKWEALHPERADLSELNRIRSQLGQYYFSSQYNQNPIPFEGNILKREWINYYEPEDLPNDPGFILQSWDTAGGAGRNNDYSVCTSFLRKERKYYLIDVIRQKLEFPDLRKKIMDSHSDMQEQYEGIPIIVLVEDKSSGSAMLQDLRRESIRINSFKPHIDKEVRFMTVTAKFENGTVLLPKSASWLDTYIEEIISFPNCKHDDQVDSTSQALGYKRNHEGRKDRKIAF